MEQIEGILQAIGLVSALLVLGTAIVRLIWSLRQPFGRAVGRTGWLRSGIFYITASLIFFGVCALLWQPLPVSLASPWRMVLMVGGEIILMGGLCLYSWGMFTLGNMYAGSTSLGAQLFAGHRLVTSGPFRYVRHPMYLGIMIAPFGGLLLFHNWTMLLVSLGFLFLPRRAAREEQALAAEFGEEWQAYASKVPAFLPRFTKLQSPGSHSTEQK